MVPSENEYFGSSLFESVQKNSDSLWPLIKNDQRYCFHGRAVGLADARLSDLELIVALAKTAGVGLCDFVPLDEAEKLQSSLDELGLKTDRMEMWVSDHSTVEKARQIIASKSLSPSDVLAFVTTDTSRTELKALDEFAQKHGTSLPMGSYVRGVQKPAACLYAQGNDGLVFATAASIGHFHENHPKSDMAYWGMLATREDRRGQGAALILGAHAIVAMHDRHGYQRFFTPIKEGNTASERLCSKLGFSKHASAALIAINTSIKPNTNE